MIFCFFSEEDICENVLVMKVNKNCITKHGVNLKIFHNIVYEKSSFFLIRNVVKFFS